MNKEKKAENVKTAKRRAQAGLMQAAHPSRAGRYKGAPTSFAHITSSDPGCWHAHGLE
jgi:hypothetical protein